MGFLPVNHEYKKKHIWQRRTTGELSVFTQRNQLTESNDLPTKLALLPQPLSSFIKNLAFFHCCNNLMHVFALSSVRNSNKSSQRYFNKLATVFCFNVL